MDAPNRIGLVNTGIGGWRIWTANDADDPTVVAAPYILAAEHERLLAERDAEIARLREALTFYANPGIYECQWMTDEGGRSVDMFYPIERDEGVIARAALGDDNG